jgi:hypothetical protein
MVYTSNANKGVFLAFLEEGYCLWVAAKKAGIPKSTAYDIKKKAAEIKIQHVENNLPPLTQQQQLAIQLKIRRPPALSEEDKDKIFEACTMDCDSSARLSSRLPSPDLRRTLQHLVFHTKGAKALKATTLPFPPLLLSVV